MNDRVEIDTRDSADESPGRTWFSSLNRTERRTFVGCFLGWATDAFDVQVYSLAIPVLISIGFLSGNAEAGLIGTSALLSSAVGGWLAGILSDKLGRVRTLQLTIGWFAVFTALSGLALNADQLLVARTLMGFGFGGEWAAGAVLMGETIRSRYRGRALGAVQSGWAIGWGVAVLASTVVATVFGPDLRWRVLFILGIVPAALVIFLRRSVPEPEVAAARPAAQSVQRASFLAIFSPQLRKRTATCVLLCVGAQGGYYSLVTFLPQFLATARGLKILALGGTLALVIIGAFCGYLFGAWLTDRVGRRPMLVSTSLAAFAIVLPMTALALPTTVFTILCFPLGFFASAYLSTMGSVLAEQFPTTVRGSGMGFCYNFGRGIGALFPFFVGTMADSLTLGVSIAVFAGVAYAAMIIAALLLRETRGIDLATV